MFKPVQVNALPNYRLWIKYADGVEGEVDLSHLVDKGVFSIWNDYAVFEKVYLGDGGAIAWTDEVEICPDNAYMAITGKSPEELFPKLRTELMNA
jgi:hypothetical protein